MLPPGLADTIRKPVQEAFAVIYVTKNVAAFYSSCHDVINQSCDIQSRLPRHTGYLSNLPYFH
jgi:hypothetical protein